MQLTKQTKDTVVYKQSHENWDSELNTRNNHLTQKYRSPLNIKHAITYMNNKTLKIRMRLGQKKERKCNLKQ
jgi:hypothetical protein